MKEMPTKEEIVKGLTWMIDLFEQNNMNRHAFEDQLGQHILALMTIAAKK